MCIKLIVCEKPSSDEATPGEDISSTPVPLYLRQREYLDLSIRARTDADADGEKAHGYAARATATSTEGGIRESINIDAIIAFTGREREGGRARSSGEARAGFGDVSQKSRKIDRVGYIARFLPLAI